MTTTFDHRAVHDDILRTRAVDAFLAATGSYLGSLEGLHEALVSFAPQSRRVLADEPALLLEDLRRIEPELRRLGWAVITATTDEGAHIQLRRGDR